MSEPTLSDSDGGTPITIANRLKNAPTTSFNTEIINIQTNSIKGKSHP